MWLLYLQQWFCKPFSWMKKSHCYQIISIIITMITLTITFFSASQKGVPYTKIFPLMIINVNFCRLEWWIYFEYTKRGGNKLSAPLGFQFRNNFFFLGTFWKCVFPFTSQCKLLFKIQRHNVKVSSRAFPCTLIFFC